MKAIILAAGKGERLMPLTQNCPKSLLEIGNGMTVLESQLISLKDNDISQVAIVVGYKAEQIEAKLKDMNGIKIKTFYNPFYNVTNNLVSAWMARNEMDDDFLLINGDDIFSNNVVKNLLRDENEICIVIDRKGSYDNDDMKVIIRGHRVKKISKKISRSQANGESIGILKFQNTGRVLFRNVLDEMVRVEKNHNVFYLAALQEVIDRGFPVNFVECKPEEWAEIDFHPDLEVIRSNIDKYAERLNAWHNLFS